MPGPFVSGVADWPADWISGANLVQPAEPGPHFPFVPVCGRIVLLHSSADFAIFAAANPECHFAKLLQLNRKDRISLECGFHPDYGPHTACKVERHVANALHRH